MKQPLILVLNSFKLSAETGKTLVRFETDATLQEARIVQVQCTFSSVSCPVLPAIVTIPKSLTFSLTNQYHIIMLPAKNYSVSRIYRAQHLRGFLVFIEFI